MKKVLIGVLIVSIIIGGLAYLWTGQEENNKDEFILENIYKVDGPEVIDELIVLSNSQKIYFKSIDGISKYNLDTRKIELINKIKKDFIFDFIDETLIICSWENYIIENSDEIASKFWIEDIEGHIINEFETNKTVRPVTCERKVLVATDNYPNSLGRYYSVDLETGDIKESNFNEFETVKISTKSDKTDVLIDNMTFKIDYPNIFISAVTIEEKEQRYLVLVDLKRRLWVAY